MRSFIYILQNLLFLFILIVFDVFFQGLVLPFGFIEVINIGILNLYFIYGFEKTLLFALILGLFKDYTEGIPLGIHGTIYSLLFIILTLLKLTVISYENKMARALGALIFNILYLSSILIILKLPVSFKFLQEAMLGIMINTILTAVVFSFTQIIKEQLQKRFIYENKRI